MYAALADSPIGKILRQDDDHHCDCGRMRGAGCLGNRVVAFAVGRRGRRMCRSSSPAHGRDI